MKNNKPIQPDDVALYIYRDFELPQLAITTKDGRDLLYVETGRVFMGGEFEGRVPHMFEYKLKDTKQARF